MSEMICGPDKATPRRSNDQTTRRLWHDSIRPGPWHIRSPIARQEPADIDYTQTHQHGEDVPQAMAEVLRTPGNPLDHTTRRQMEPHFGDLSRVRVHTDARAGGSAKAIGAAAYTYRDNVVFANGSQGYDGQAF